MTVIDLKNKLKENSIDIFGFCIQNQINPKSLIDMNDKLVISEQLKEKLNTHLKEIEDKEGIFFDTIKNSGLKINNDRVSIELDNKKQIFHLEIDASMLSKIDFS